MLNKEKKPKINSGLPEESTAAVECFVPGFGRPQVPVFCRVVQGQWQDSEGCSRSSLPKKNKQVFVCECSGYR